MSWLLKKLLGHIGGVVHVGGQVLSGVEQVAVEGASTSVGQSIPYPGDRVIFTVPGTGEDWVLEGQGGVPLQLTRKK